MEPRMEVLPEKKFVGKRLMMSFADNKTFELWSGLMPRRKEIANATGTELYSIEVYDMLYFTSFNPETEFEKWAAVEVTDFDHVPAGMETITIPPGKYAVFIHKGPASTGQQTYQQIFGAWFPQSAYLVDNRPHFAVMGDRYKNDHADSEEEIWIPVRER